MTAVDRAIDRVYEVKVPGKVTSKIKLPPVVPADAPEFVQTVTAELMAMRGDSVPVSKFPVDGRFPTGTTQYEKRNIAVNIPIWQPELCIQCGMCSFVCPHATIRIKAYDPKMLEKAPQTFKSIDAKGKEFAGMKFTVQVAPEDCTGCGACVQTCPALSEARTSSRPAARPSTWRCRSRSAQRERDNYSFFLSIPEHRPLAVQGQHGQRQPVDPAAVRVLRRLRRLRRDGLRQAADATVRRPRLHRQRDRLLLDLRRQPADDALYDAAGRPRPDLVQQPLRGQRRIRDGHAADRRSSSS